ncbi:hypothetical protein CP556_14115 [Natrinema sp. CBA1119]|uniref:hypothetical protein n=1 Tax=Natrinema sp. CBA1119 TaxID=1608465 RepID=UPI000BF569D4|nr:hypothetical protein [Natrinema sp. CBA1119]PGF17142.1 hypothetical protein CP556_14115 [Natrinema sp. CBA1119]
MADIKLVNKDRTIVGVDPETGDEVPIEFDQTSIGQASVDRLSINQSGQYVYPSGRDKITTGPVDRTADPSGDSVTVSVGGTDHEFWIPDIPEVIAHEFVINIPDGNYSNVNIFIPPFKTADIVGHDDAGNSSIEEGAALVPWIRGNPTTPTNVKFNSATLVGSQGAIAPVIEGVNFLGEAPGSDEPVSVPVYGCQNVSFRQVSFEGCAADRGFLIYSSTATIRDGCDFGSSDLTLGIETKHNSMVSIDTFGDLTTGTVNDYLIWTDDGSFAVIEDTNVSAGKGLFNHVLGLSVYQKENRIYPRPSGARFNGSTSDQTISTNTLGNNAEVLEFDTVDYDYGGGAQPGSFQYETPVKGRYEIKAQVQWISPPAGTRL